MAISAAVTRTAVSLALVSVIACLPSAADGATAAGGGSTTPPSGASTAAVTGTAAGAQPERLVPGRSGVFSEAITSPVRGSGVSPTGVIVPTRFLEQRMSWERCLTDDEIAELVAYGFPRNVSRLECATYTAPLDWDRPDNGTRVTIAVSRLRAGKPSPSGGVVFSNPGGPGQPGRDMPLVFLLAKRSKLLASQDVYGIDPRGTGASTNVTCSVRPVASVDHRDRTAGNLGLILDTARLGAQYCDVKGGTLINHVTTENTVKDLDLLRQLVGARQINWIGYSAGTWLGAYYAAYFPPQTGRFVLDSNVEFTSTWQQITLNQPKGFERRFRSDFTPWAASHHAAYGLGTTSTAVRSFYERLRKDLGDFPVGAYDGPTLDLTIAEALYTRDSFPDLAEFLGELRAIVDMLREGRTSGAARSRTALARRFPRLAAVAERGAGEGRRLLGPLVTGRAASRPAGATPVSAVDASDATSLAITCGDTAWRGAEDRLIQDSGSQGSRYPLIGYRIVEEPCMFWQRGGGDLPEITGAGVPQILMVQSEHDPATPIEGARRAAARVPGARLLVVRNEGEHGLYAGGNSCVDRAVEGFIVDGVLPAAGATCSGLPIPGPGVSPGRRAGTVPPRNPLVALTEIAELVSADPD
ncbi:MAG: alpha/beta hydrolase [Actinomycetales bacterium]|nr:alpha/beta hydrolase [Actinomycetales bacterium]